MDASAGASEGLAGWIPRGILGCLLCVVVVLICVLGVLCMLRLAWWFWQVVLANRVGITGGVEVL